MDQTLYTKARQGGEAKSFDLIIVGGGVNGTGIARDAALRGLSVCLFEKGDLACGTSSYSSKLIHGGLRYLEFGALRLVREALKERALLLKMMPGFISPLRLILPHIKGMRPQWLLRLGLWLYDHLAPRGTLQSSQKLALKTHEFGTPLRLRDRVGFEFSDCLVDDARLVIFNALEAQAEGAEIFPFRQVLRAERDDGAWYVKTDHDGEIVRGKILINATGPYVNQFIEGAMDGFPAHALRLLRGSHIVVPKLYDHDRAYLLQQKDGRVVFAIPYEDKFTLVGTTEAQHETGLDSIEASDAEIDYLITVVNQTFKRQVGLDDLVWSFAGVRPLIEQVGKSDRGVSRDYKLELVEGSGAPVLHVYGGKLTTFRALAKAAVDKLSPYFSYLEPSQTEKVVFTAFEGEDFSDWEAQFHKRLNFLPALQRKRYVRSYGRRADWFLRDVTSEEDLGEHFGGGLSVVEVRYLIQHEWARNVEDILWRRTKCGLHMTAQDIERFTDWFTTQQVGDKIL